MSKGHACLAYYAALCEIGYITKSELKTFEKDGSNLLGHPVANSKLGIDFSNGSLGMGLSLGIGLAISSKKKKLNFNVYVILGDGECNEGSVWEAAMSGAHFNLDNLFAIIDRNNFQQTGTSDEIMSLKNLKEKWSSFGWNVLEIDGHNISEIVNALSIKLENKPTAVIANTIKGKGFSFSENDNNWHHAVAVFDHTAKQGLLYIDGKLDAQSGIGGIKFNDPQGKLCIASACPGDFLPGQIDDVAVFNVALKEGDIKSIMDKGLKKVLDAAAVSPMGKLTTIWAATKAQ